MKILPYTPEYWPQMWAIMQPVFADGETYPYAMDISENGAQEMWLEKTQAQFVAIDDTETVLGTYYIKPNQPTLAAHIANCGYLVSESARGKGIAGLMCKHSQITGRELGFRGLQFNLVVSTNTGALRLWQKHGFDIIGTIPGAFKSRSQGYVDAHIMFKSLI